ncbi:MAG: DUF998 domain-containing protein [Acidimicrobiales bacterium]
MVIAGVLSLLGLMVVVGSLGYLHLAPTGLSPVRNAVSQYGITSFRAGYRVATIALGVAGVALAVGLDRALSSHGRSAVVAGLVVFALARGAISWFPMDAPGSTRTTTGQLHGLLATVAFAAVTFDAFRLGGVISSRPSWQGLAPASTALGVAMLACLLGMLLAGANPAVRERFGAIERGFYLAAITWFAVFGIACATGPR